MIAAHQKAADERDSEAQYILGLLYEMFKEYDLAVKYYTTAAEQINDRAGLSLECMYADGRGVDQNY